MHIQQCKYNSKYLTAISCSVWLVILYILHNWVLLWTLPPHAEHHWVSTAVAMITYLNIAQWRRTDMEKLNYKCLSSKTQTLYAASTPCSRTRWLLGRTYCTSHLCPIFRVEEKNKAMGSLGQWWIEQKVRSQGLFMAIAWRGHREDMHSTPCRNC